jgi:hypothetical protein
LEYKLASTAAWPKKGSKLVYEWGEQVGQMAINDDIFHVGTYSFIDPPRFRITGHRSKQVVIGVLPLDLDPSTSASDFETVFPESGTLDIDGIKYSYTGKSLYFDGSAPRGPFGLRNITSWNSPYNTDPTGGYTYQGGKAIEFLMFDWLNGAEGASYALAAVISSSAGHSWQNQQTQFKPWIRTGGQLVYLRNRVRMYSSGIPDWVPSTDEKVYVTNGLIGVSVLSEVKTEYLHSYGTFAYLDNDDRVTLYSYCAASGDPDQTIQHLLNIYCRLSGTTPTFPGDFTIASQAVSSSQTVNLYA